MSWVKEGEETNLKNMLILMQLHIKVESRLERKEGEAARERELAHAREKLVR